MRWYFPAAVAPTRTGVLGFVAVKILDQVLNLVAERRMGPKSDLVQIAVPSAREQGNEDCSERIHLVN